MSSISSIINSEGEIVMKVKKIEDLMKIKEKIRPIIEMRLKHIKNGKTKIH